MIKVGQTREEYVEEYLNLWKDWDPEAKEEDILLCIELHWDKLVQPLIDSGRAEI